MISFLYPYQSIRGECGNSMQDLHIERIIRHFTGDDKKQKYILEILSSFENNVKIIYYRQHLFQDLYNFPKFFERLQELYKKLEKLYEDHRAFKLQFANMRNDYEAPQSLFNDLIKDFCYMLRELMWVYKELATMMEKYNFTSEALKKYQNFINQKYQHYSFGELYNLLDDIIMNSNYYEMEVSIDKDLKIINSSLLKSVSSKKVFQRHKDLLVPLNVANHNIYRNVYNDARINLFKILDDIYYGLMAIFDCHEELVFLDFGINLYNLARRLKMEVVFPTFSKNGMEYTDLYDIFLGIKGIEEIYQVVPVFPNSIKVSEKESGRLIVGDNNTGKTVFIRSIGIAQVFAQAGLFVTAKHAKISIRNRILTFLSSKEISTLVGGRFEKEVSVISKIVDEVDHNSLIIMNEIFQSTSYEAGVEALYNILTYLTNKDTLWLTVTHLRSLIDKREDFVRETNKDFKVLTTAIEGLRYLVKEY